MAIVGAFMVPHPPLIIPDIGRGGEVQIEETTRAYKKVEDMVAELETAKIIITSLVKHADCSILLHQG